MRLRRKYQVPAESEVEEAVRQVLGRTGEVGSLRAFQEMVAARLRRKGGNPRVSGRRLLKVAAGMPEVKVVVARRRAAAPARRCFLCGSDFEKQEVVDLFGGKTRGGLVCPHCGFRLDRPASAPRRYTFLRA